MKLSGLKCIIDKTIYGVKAIDAEIKPDNFVLINLETIRYKQKQFINDTIIDADTTDALIMLSSNPCACSPTKGENIYHNNGLWC